MMANPAEAAEASCVSVSNAIINPQYCVPYPIELIIKEERTFASNNFTVTDTNHNLVFRIKSPMVTIVTPRDRRFILDARGNTLLNLRNAIMKDSWKAFRGESREERDLIFTKKLSSLFQLRTKHDVFLANNTTGVCNFKIKESFFERSWVVYLAESDNVVAQIKKKYGFFSRDKFMVTVAPNIDYAFIVALVVTFDDRSKS